jgi:hypothetical protein
MRRINQEEAIPWIWLIICGPFDVSTQQEGSADTLEQRIIAYHHYQEEGLRSVPIHYQKH